MKADPPLDTRCRDKFLVQSAPITPEKEFASIAAVVSVAGSKPRTRCTALLTLVAQLESTEKGQIQERKIRVNWLAPLGSQEQGANQAVLATPNKQSIVNGVRSLPAARLTHKC